MGRKAKSSGELNKSTMIREAFAKNPKAKAKDVADALKAQGVDVSVNLVYLVKGKVAGGKKRAAKAAKATPAASHGDALATIMKVKKVAEEIGGMKTLKALVEALSE
jgi:hypothetical protein